MWWLEEEEEEEKISQLFVYKTEDVDIPEKKKVQLEVGSDRHWSQNWGMLTNSWLFTKVKKIKVGMSDTAHGTEETKEHQKCSQMATYCLDSCTYI